MENPYYGSFGGKTHYFRKHPSPAFPTTIHFNRVFHYKPFWGTPIFGNHPFPCETSPAGPSDDLPRSSVGTSSSRALLQARRILKRKQVRPEVEKRSERKPRVHFKKGPPKMWPFSVQGNLKSPAISGRV